MIQNKNTRDIFMRNVIAGTLDYLNRNVKILQYVDDKEQSYDVRFYYNFGQDEQFMKDFFVELPHGCLVYEHAEGNFETRPYGVMKFTTFTIRPNDVTNRYVRGTFTNESYTANMEKRLSAYSAYLMRIPVTIKLSVDVQADNLGQAMRVIEAVVSTIYKSNIMYFSYGSLRVPAEIMMSDGADMEKKTEFTYDDSQVAHSKFEFDINTTFPAWDHTSDISRGQKIKEFRLSLNDESHVIDENTYVQGLVELYLL